MGVTSTNSGRLELNLSLFEKRDGKSHLGTILLWLFQESGDSAWSSVLCMVIRSLHGHPFVAACERIFGDNA